MESVEDAYAIDPCPSGVCPVTIGGKELGKEGLKYLPLIALSASEAGFVCRSRGALDFSPHLCCWRCCSPGSSLASECSHGTWRRNRSCITKRQRQTGRAGKVTSTLGGWSKSSKCTFLWERATTSRAGGRPPLTTIAATPRAPAPARSLRRQKSAARRRRASARMSRPLPKLAIPSFQGCVTRPRDHRQS